MNHRTARRVASTAYRVMILAAICVATPHSAFAQENAARYTGDPRTIAHDFLDLEKDFGARPEHHATVNRIINRALAEVPVKPDAATADAVRTLQAIDAVLRAEGFSFKDNLLLSVGIARKQIDCDNYCALYVAIAEVMKIPLVPVYAPDHSFVRYYFSDGSFLNWEPTQGKSLPDSFYVKAKGIAQPSIEKGVYLKALSRKEFVAVEYNNIGAHLIMAKKLREAVTYLSAAIAFYPAFSSAWHNRGSARLALAMLPEARSDLETAVGLDPLRATSRTALGDAYSDLREYQKAVQHYAASIKLDPTNHIPYHNMAVAMQRLGRDGDARAWEKKAKEIRAKYGH